MNEYLHKYLDGHSYGHSYEYSYNYSNEHSDELLDEHLHQHSYEHIKMSREKPPVSTERLSPFPRNNQKLTCIHYWAPFSILWCVNFTTYLYQTILWCLNNYLYILYHPMVSKSYHVPIYTTLLCLNNYLYILYHPVITGYHVL